MPPQTMNYRGTEVWLEDNHGSRLPLAENPQINENLQTVSVAVYPEPKSLFTLVWRREPSAEPMSALCQVFISGGYLTPEIPDFCVATVAMDKEKRKTQTRTTWGHQNAPYRRTGYLRTGRRCDLPKRKLNNTVGCSLRLEIRRIDGQVHQPQWVIGPDNLEVRESNAHKMTIIDDEEADMLPFATFLFYFPEMGNEQGENKMGGQGIISNAAGSSKISTVQRFPNNISGGSQSDDEEGSIWTKKRARSEDGKTTSSPDKNETIYVKPSHANPSWRVINPGPSIKPKKKVFRKVEVVISPKKPSPKKPRIQENIAKLDPVKIEETEPEECNITSGGKHPSCQSDLADDYLALDKIEKDLKKKLKEKIKAKQNNIHYLRHLLESD